MCKRANGEKRIMEEAKKKLCLGTDANRKEWERRDGFGMVQ